MVNFLLTQVNLSTLRMVKSYVKRQKLINLTFPLGMLVKLTGLSDTPKRTAQASPAYGFPIPEFQGVSA